MKSIEPTISSDTITEFVDTAQSVIDASPQMNESNTKVKLIQPFLQDILCWDIHHMELEYSVQMGGQTYHVDYALTIADIPKVFVEAKGCDTDLKDKHADQLQSYLKLQDVTWGLLTNGRDYEIYQLQIESGRAEFYCIADISIDELPSYRQSLSAISKPAIESGNAADVVRYIREVSQAEQTLAARKAEIANQIAETVTNETTDVIYQDVEQEAKQLVDRLIETLQTDQSSVVDSGNSPAPASTSEPFGPDEVSFPVKSLQEISDADDAHAAVYPSNERGIEFLKDHQAWGFISIGSTPEYFFIYLTKPYQHIRYCGTVDEIVDSDTFLTRNDIPKDRHKYGKNKKVVTFSELFELEEPIPIGSKNPHRMQGLLYTTLSDVKSANTTDEL